MLQSHNQDVHQKLSVIRELLTEYQLDAYIFPSNDPHQSEYVAEHWKGREWLSGFDGSAGIVVVTQSAAGMWTDSRYFLQAEQQLKDSPIQFQKLQGYSPKAYYDWIKAELKEGGRLGIDGKLLSHEAFKALVAEFEPASISLVTDVDLLDLAWQDRPALPSDPVFDWDANYCGLERSEKIEFVRAEMAAKNCDHHVLSTLDDIAWLFNLRGRDVECNPVFYAYAVISKENVLLFIEPSKVNAELKGKLSQDGIQIQGYGEFVGHLGLLEGKILLDRQVFPHAFEEKFGKSAELVKGNNPTTLKKACKTEIELSHLRKTMENDGAALVEVAMTIAQKLDAGEQVTEFQVGELLIERRSRRAGYFGESFDAIAGYGPNGAIVHYRPRPHECAVLAKQGILLLDSGGQYLGGTTDVTRTFALGEVEEEVKAAYTRVLKGHLALGAAKFPKGTTGLQLDVLARFSLWQAGLNFGHGTGHGVGFFLNVHEGPQSIGPTASPRSLQAFLPGMIVSNEPGYYAEGRFGIRIENLIVAREFEGHEGFLEFENLTLFPYEWALIDQSLLNSEELAWIEAYHEEVFLRLSPLLDAEGRDWLRKKCQKPN